MLNLHHLEKSRSFRIVWLLEELGLNYQLTPHQRNSQFLAPEYLQKINGLGKAPILEDNGKAISESGFIIEYLMQKHDTAYTFHPSYAQQPQAWEHYTFWLHFAEASAMPNFVMRLIFKRIAKGTPFPAKWIAKAIRNKIESSYLTPNINNILRLMETHLQEHTWFAGEQFSAADVQMHFVGWSAQQSGLSPESYPAITAWIARCQARAAFQRAIAKGGAL